MSLSKLEKDITTPSPPITLLDCLPVPVGLCSRDDYCFLFANQQMASLLESEASELCGHSLPEKLLNSVDARNFRDKLEEAGCISGLQVLYTGGDGRQRVLTINAAAVDYSEGAVWAVTVAESLPLQEFNQSSELVNHAIDSVQELIAYINKEFRYELVNLAFSHMLGYAPGELVGKPIVDVVGKRFFHEKAKPALERCFQGEKVNLFGWVNYKHIGDRYMRVSYSPYYDNGKVKGAVICASDFTERHYIDRALQASEEKYRQIFALETDMIVVYDGDTLRVIDCNDAALKTFGYTRPEFLQLTAMDLSSESDKTRQFLSGLVESAPGRRYERRQRRADGSVFDSEGSSSCFSISGKRFYCTVGRDITHPKSIERDLQESNARFRAIVEASPLPLVISRLSDGCIVYANDKAGTELLVSGQAIVGSDIKQIFRNEKQRIEILQSLRRKGSVSDVQISFRGQDKKKRWLSCTASLITFLGDECVATGFIDITESRQLAKQLRYQASHDSLTGLVNRREFETRLRRTINSAKRQQSQHALCFIDLDQFKLVNDSCGHAAGDALLRELSARLAGSLRQRDTLARLGGDEFAVIIEHCSLDEAIKISESLRQTIETLEFSWNTRDFDIGASIGLVAINSDSEDASTVLKSADQACYAAKNAGRNRVHTYDQHKEEMQRRQVDLEWIAQIKESIREDRLCLYQQKAEPARRNTQLPIYHEILVRLIDVDQNIVLPGDILPLAERFDLATQIDRWVVSHALEWLNQNREGMNGSDIWALNISGQSLSDISFCEYLTDKLNSLSFPTHHLCFEITETAAINKLLEARNFLSTLRACGCKIALDDFGSGLASYGYLKNLPVDFLKIDGMFVRDVSDDKFDREFVRSINDIGHALGILTIAEFVESENQHQTLVEIGVDYCQGFALDKPAPILTSTKKTQP